MLSWSHRRRPTRARRIDPGFTKRVRSTRLRATAGAGSMLPPPARDVGRSHGCSAPRCAARNNQRQGVDSGASTTSSGLHCRSSGAHSSAGRAPPWHGGGRRFEPGWSSCRGPRKRAFLNLRSVSRSFRINHAALRAFQRQTPLDCEGERRGGRLPPKGRNECVPRSQLRSSCWLRHSLSQERQAQNRRKRAAP